MKIGIVGATGLVGAQALRLASQDPRVSVVSVLARRELATGPKTELNVSSNWNEELLADWAQGLDTIFCALGTTIAKAGSAQAFVAIDKILVLQVARAARRAGVSNFVLVSSVGANSVSKSLYLRAKGELEGELRALGFSRLVILRPSLLLGTRGESRKLESLAIQAAPALSLFCVGRLRKYRPIRAVSVARSGLEAALCPSVGAVIELEGESLSFESKRESP